MPGQTFGLLEAMPANGGESGFVIGKGDEAISNVADCRYAERAAQSPARAAAVGDRHNSGDVDALFAPVAEALQTSQQYR